MIKRKTLTYTTLAFKLLFSLFFFSFLTETLSAQNILIYSPTHGYETTVSEDRGLMLVEIRSTTPVFEILVNGKKRDFRNPHKTRLFVRYLLKAGKNDFRVSVTTAQTITIQSFILNLGTPEEVSTEQAQTSETIQFKKEFLAAKVPVQKIIRTRKHPLSLFALAGLEHSDNLAYSVLASSGLRSKIMLQPSFKFQWKKHQFLLHGLAYREKILASGYENDEITVNLFSLDWMQNLSFAALKVTGGLGDLDNEFGLVMGNTHLSKDVFVGAELSRKFKKDDLLQLRLSLTDKNLDTGEAGAYDPDGMLWNLGAHWKTHTLGVKSHFFGAYKIYNARGVFQNHNILHFGAQGTHPFRQEMELRASLQLSKTLYDMYDSVKGGQESTSWTQLSFGTTHPLLKAYDITLLGEFRMTEQTSNIQGLDYSETMLSVSMFYLY